MIRERDYGGGAARKRSRDKDGGRGGKFGTAEIDGGLNKTLNIKVESNDAVGKVGEPVDDLLCGVQRDNRRRNDFNSISE